MTDYLELAVEENVEALREAHRRLEGVLPDRNGADQAQLKTGEDTSRSRLPAEEPDGTSVAQLAPVDVGTVAASAQTDAEELPLLEQLARTAQLDQAVYARAAAQFTEETGQTARRSGSLTELSRRTNLGGDLSASDQISSVERSVAAGAGQTGGQNWAEQVDRAFRRDSRRYDGGFFLY